jgi:hypothetical protein
MDESESVKSTIERAYGKEAHERARQRIIEWCSEVERELLRHDEGEWREFRQAGGAEPPPLSDRTSRDDLQTVHWDRQDSTYLFRFLQRKTEALGIALAEGRL